MEPAADQAFAQATAFQKMWMDAFGGMAEVWTRASPGQPPNEAMKEMRAGMLKILTQSWEEFMRSPQFLEYMKKSMDGFMTLQKYSSDAMTRGRHGAQAPAREDIDNILMAIRHMERRLLDRMEEVDASVAGTARRLDALEKNGKEKPPAAARKTATRKPAAKKRRSS
jgi:hypothetical protein